MATLTKSLEKVSLDLNKESKTAIAVRIIGATIDGDAKRIKKILDESNDDSVRFCALSGIFYTIGVSDNLGETLQIEFRGDVLREIISFVDSFESILQKNEYDLYPVAVLPGEEKKKELFWLTVWGNLFKTVLFKAIRPGRYVNKDAIYENFGLLNKIILIAKEYELLDKQSFFETAISTAVSDMLDAMYFSSLSPSVGKIWNSGRAADEYFMRKIVLFNPLIPENIKAEFGKRWQAWFLLEDKSKASGKKPKKGDLEAQMQSILAEL